MPLLDHFHPPLSERRQWHAFHSVWASVIALDLNRQLPAGYFADPNVEFNIEIDVAAFEEQGAKNGFASWTPPAPTLTAPMALVTDVVEIAVYNSEAGPVLVGAIELVSPANKERPQTRDAFVSKCASYLQQAMGLIVVDLVTSRKADLDAALVQRVTDLTVTPSDLWAAAYRPGLHGEEPTFETWHHPLALGDSLPTLPFWLKNGPCIKLDLEATYAHTLQQQHMIGTSQGGGAATC
ncbi:MAG: DUF4058 family protein [Planctomycetes bacterium]|jgi:hypothetical protein|nr:DUF4058 family protein [Planctomycetota bacterium]